MKLILLIILILIFLFFFQSFSSSSFSGEGFTQKISYPTDFPSYDDYPVRYPYFGREQSYLRYWLFPLGQYYPAEPYFYAATEFPMPVCGGWAK